MNRTLLVLLLSIAAIAGLYIWWESGRQTETKAWDLVPEDALVFYEYQRNSPHDPTDLLVRSFLSDSIRKHLLRSDQMLLSAHVMGKEGMGIVLYLKDAPGIEQSFIAALKSSGSFKERIFDGFKILEGSFKRGNTVSATQINGVLVISSVSLLIEDVIRIANSKEKKNFTLHQQALFRLARSKADSSNVFVDLSQLDKVFNLFLSERNQNPVPFPLMQSAAMESKWQEDDLQLSGFAIDSLEGQKSILSLFNRQRPVPVTLQRIVSNRTGLLLHWGISDFALWNQDRLEFCNVRAPWVRDSLDVLREKFGFDAVEFYRALNGEIGSCTSGIYSGEVLIMGVKHGDAVTSLMAKLQGEKVPDQQESYSQYRIHRLMSPQFPRTLFWPIAARKMNYFVLTGQHLIFSENMQDIKAFIDDWDAENTWGKLSAWNDFLATSQDTNFGIIFDGLNWWPSLRGTFKERWQAFGDSSRFMNMDKGSFQFSRLEQKYYFNGVLKFNSKHKVSGKRGKEKLIETTLSLPTHLTVVRNHNTGDLELLVQDGSGALNLFSTGLNKVFTGQLDGKIHSEIHQIDFFKNRKLQYLFATDKSLLLMDRLGRTVEGFPKKLQGDNPVQYLTVLDYDHNRNYRYLTADTKGNLSLYDRNGVPVLDWKKIELKDALWVAPRAVRMQGKDYLIAITGNGNVHAFSRKGELLPGFPVILKSRPFGNWFFETDKGTILLTGNDGEVIEIDLKGKMISKTNLPRSSAGSRFSLVPSQEMGQFVFSRTDRGKAAVLNNKGEVIFEIENPGSDELYLTFTELARGRRVFAFNDPQQEFSYFYDEKGQAFFSRPIENQQRPVIVSDKSGVLYFFGVNKGKITRYTTGQGK